MGPPELREVIAIGENVYVKFIPMCDRFVILDANRPHDQKANYEGLDRDQCLRLLCLTCRAPVSQPGDICVNRLGPPDNAL